MSQKQPLVNRMLESNRTTELFSLCLRFKRTLLKLTSSSSSFDFPLVEALLLILSFQSFFTIYEIVFEKQLESLQFTSTSLIYLHYPGSSQYLGCLICLVFLLSEVWYLRQMYFCLGNYCKAMTRTRKWQRKATRQNFLQAERGTTRGYRDFGIQPKT